MATKVKVPKSIAGVRVPKRLRKSKTLESLLKDPLARTVVADALVAAAGAAAAALARHRPSTSQVVRTGANAAEAGGRAMSATTEVVGAAMGAVADAAHTAPTGESEPARSERPRKRHADDEATRRH